MIVKPPAYSEVARWRREGREGKGRDHGRGERGEAEVCNIP